MMEFSVAPHYGNARDPSIFRQRSNMSDTPFSAPSTESMNSLLPGFEFTAQVSGNAHGAVYFANQKSLERQVAIKLLSPGSLHASESKSRAAAGLKHPNLISIFDSGMVAGMPYIVMEFVPGKSLARSTRGSAVEFAQAMLLIGGICDGLSHANGNGVVHGHFCPSGVLLNQKAEPKIGNFGLPHSTQENSSDDDISAYSSPEVLANPGAATPRSDVFSVAAVFYELIAGRRHRADASPPSVVCGCRPEIDAVWKQATDPDPAKRMADVSAFHTALKQAAEGGKSKLANLPKAPPRELSGANATTDNSAPNHAKLGSGKVGFDWKLVRNLLIIGVLIYGIMLANDFVGKARAQREKENQVILAKQAAAKEAAIAAAVANRQPTELPRIPVRQGNESDIPKAPVETESAMDSLERLRTRLASGSRSEMPAGSVARGGSDYLFVSKPMTWADATWFAEDHGGHLAIPDVEADFPWLSDELAKGKAAWIGIARGGGKAWVTVAGNIWESASEPSGSGQHLSLGKTATAADGVGSRLPFIIQWHRDGSNPGKLASQLSATAGSLSKSDPIFPPGTVAFGDHRYLRVVRPVSWPDALSMAQSAGGNLLVVSSGDEAANLKSMVAKLDPDSRLWLGGTLEGSLWTWCTGEPWVSAQWSDDSSASDENSALCIRPKGGWDALVRNEEASGFIIEWSADAKAGATKPAKTADEAGALLTRAKEVVVAAQAKHDADIASNSKKLEWELDAFIRNLNKSGQAQWTPHVGRIKECIRNNRLNVDGLKSGDIEYSTETLKLANYHVDKQAQIDKQFEKSTETIRDAFVSKLSEIRAKAKSSGQPKLEEDTAEAIENAEDLNSWLSSLGLNPIPE